MCEDCKHCTQRVEPFLDLSLPIVDEHSKLTSSDNSEWDKKSKKDQKRSYFLSSKKSKKSEDTKDDTGELVDPNENVVTKNQSKKQKKQLLKKGKVKCNF